MCDDRKSWMIYMEVAGVGKVNLKSCLYGFARD